MSDAILVLLEKYQLAYQKIKDYRIRLSTREGQRGTPGFKKRNFHFNVHMKHSKISTIWIWKHMVDPISLHNGNDDS